MVRAIFLNIAACAVCLLAIGAGFVAVSRFQDTRRESSVQTDPWPPESPIALAQDRDTLLMFAHPHCPCTKASLQELNRVISKCPGRVAVHVFFFSPSSYPSKWTLTDLWRTASAIPDVAVRPDPEGSIASQFGAQTSGCLLLFNPHGELLFRGGITTECGRTGDSVSEERLLSLVTGKEHGVVQAPVYGRPLTSENETAQAVVSN